MSNALYNPFKQQLLDNSSAMDFDTDAIQAVLADAADYTFSAAHDELTGGARDVAAAAIVAQSATLTGPTCTNGLFDTNDFTWSSVTGDQSEDIILANTTVTNGRLVSFYDTGITGMPVTPNGGNINVTVNASGWFAL
jgi:hypothetical protein